MWILSGPVLRCPWEALPWETGPTWWASPKVVHLPTMGTNIVARVFSQ